MSLVGRSYWVKNIIAATGRIANEASCVTRSPGVSSHAASSDRYKVVCSVHISPRCFEICCFGAARCEPRVTHCARSFATGNPCLDVWLNCASDWSQEQTVWAHVNETEEEAANFHQLVKEKIVEVEK